MVLISPRRRVESRRLRGRHTTARWQTSRTEKYNIHAIIRSSFVHIVHIVQRCTQTFFPKPFLFSIRRHKFSISNLILLLLLLLFAAMSFHWIEFYSLLLLRATNGSESCAPSRRVYTYVLRITFVQRMEWKNKLFSILRQDKWSFSVWNWYSRSRERVKVQRNNVRSHVMTTFQPYSRLLARRVWAACAMPFVI